MRTKNQRSFTYKSIYGIVLLSLSLFSFGVWNIPTVHAQKAAVAQISTGATISISSDQASFGTTDAVLLHVTITNTNNDTVNVLKWLTPMDDAEKPLFGVMLNGKPVRYLGKIVKRAPPTEQDYTILAAGESVTRDVDISAYYDLSVSGNYSVTYNTNSAEMYADYNNGTLVRSAGNLVSNTLELLIAAHTFSAAKKIEGITTNGSNTFNSCSVSQQTALINARQAAGTYANGAVAYFSANKHGARYSTWFGVFNTSRYNVVLNHFNAIHNAANNANPMAFDCTCTDSSYAYVYPDEPYDIYLCQAFWSAPPTGTDSKAGTLIHEISHFIVVANTDDYAYGKDDAKALAISNPALAIMNADSHEYFAENTPPLEPPATLTLYSIKEQDGWVLESSETSNVGGSINNSATTFNLGDNVARRQYRGILSFSTGAGLPDTAHITGVTLKVKTSSVVGGGNPVTTFQGFMVDVKKGFFGATALLQAGDFQSLATKSYGPFNTASVGGWYSINLASPDAYINKLSTNGGLTQIRLRFNLDDNNNAIANYLSLFSGNTTTAANRPQLVITYYVP